jgi:alcohol dehydrogenase (cytochrome c)/quinohemoprotein ethanol dehydrogenase
MLNTPEAFSAVVLDGVLQANGMSSFRGRLTSEEVQAVRAYLIERANLAKTASTPGR